MKTEKEERKELLKQYGFNLEKDVKSYVPIIHTVSFSGHALGNVMLGK